MKKTITSLAALLLSTFASYAQTGSWKAYMSYHEPQQIIKAGQQLFVRASNDLYSYNLNDHSIRTFDKMNALNDTYINHIAWNQEVQRLIIIYKNQNIDLMDANGDVYNLSSLYNKSMMGDKTINSVYINGPYAYLATGFGIVKVNMSRCEIAESYIMNHSISNVGIQGDIIYAKINEEYTKTWADAISYKYDGDLSDLIHVENSIVTATIMAPLSTNLINPHNWSITTEVPADIFNQDLSDWDNYIETVKTLQPGGPKNNEFTFLNFKNNRLYTCGGGSKSVYAVDLARKGTIQIFDGNEWSHLQDENIKGFFPGTESSSWEFIDMEEMDVDPFDSKHIFGGSRTGLYEFYDGQLKSYYNKDNSLLKTATTSNKYVLTRTVKFDKKGNLWLIQSQVDNQSIIKISKDGEWSLHNQPELIENSKSLNALQGLFEDSRGYLWFVNCYWTNMSFYCYDPQSDKIINSFTILVNQDGVSYNDYRPFKIAEDLEGNIWIATNIGPFVVEKENIGKENANVTQIKVPRNDGSNYADYLFAGTMTNSIVVDGANRKWIGTENSGVYLISADNMTQLQHFTAENSPLLSNNIEALAIDNETGELYIATDYGLCSFTTDATAAESDMTTDNIYAFPNPVVKDYNGTITVRGLTLDADVKILSVSGKLIAQGRSNGGTYTWNGRDTSGRRVATGIYMVVTATKEGKKGTVCKIAVIN